MEEMASDLGSLTRQFHDLLGRQHGTRFALTHLMLEPLACPCCDSSNVVVLWFKCADCGVVTACDHATPYARPKPDRRSEPRD